MLASEEPVMVSIIAGLKRLTLPNYAGEHVQEFIKTGPSNENRRQGSVVYTL